MKGILYLIPQFFYSPDDGGGTGDVTNLPEVPSPSEDDIDALAGDDGDDADDPDEAGADELPEGDDKDADKRDDDEEDVEKDKDDEDVVDEDKDKDKEKDKKKEKVEEDEDEEPTGDKRIPSLKALKTAYPDIFKKFPHVRTAIAEHQQFRNIYSSIDEAKEAAEGHDNFLKISDKLMDEGDFGFLLDELNKADGAATTRMVRKILPAILERSRDLYMDITEAPIQQFVHAAYRRAKSDGNKNLENSALHIWKFLGKEGLPSAADTGPDPKDEEFQKRVTEFENKKLGDARQTVNQEIRESLVDLIENAVDPNDALKGTTKKALVNELIRLVDEDVAGDRNHMSRVDRLWANARRSSYANGHLSRIISAYLERAKQVLPKHARKVREENNISDDQQDKDKKGERRPAERRESKEPIRRPSAHGNPPRPRTIRETNPRDIDWSRTSDEDVLGGRAVLRKR